uniref:Tachykinin precursor 4 n=2 Tax=Cercopithecinae TaxID=9528 RepID=A0A2K5YFR7_MANLE
MLPCLALLLLMELSVCTVAGDGEVELSPKAETWITVALERPLIQPRRKKAYQVEHTFQGLLGKRSLSTEGREDEAQGSE